MLRCSVLSATDHPALPHRRPVSPRSTSHPAAATQPWQTSCAQHTPPPPPDQPKIGAIQWDGLPARRLRPCSPRVGAHRASRAPEMQPGSRGSRAGLALQGLAATCGVLRKGPTSYVTWREGSPLSGSSSADSTFVQGLRHALVAALRRAKPPIPTSPLLRLSPPPVPLKTLGMVGPGPGVVGNRAG